MEQLPNTVPSNLLDPKTVKAFMHSKAFWAENSNFEFSWQIQLQSWLHGAYQILVVVAEIAIVGPELVWARLWGCMTE